MGARAYDPNTHGFLTVDPLPPVPGTGWAANPYEYAGNNPLTYTDPLGLKPLTDSELSDENSWFNRNATTIGVLSVVAGTVLSVVAPLVPIPGLDIAVAALGGALSNAGTNILSQKATGGTVNWGEVGIDAAIGAGIGAATFGLGELIAPSKVGIGAVLTGKGMATTVSKGTQLVANVSVRTGYGMLQSASDVAVNANMDSHQQNPTEQGESVVRGAVGSGLSGFVSSELPIGTQIGLNMLTTVIGG
jgi:uncharacterized protein RhaS with RHS repeats